MLHRKIDNLTKVADSEVRRTLALLELSAFSCSTTCRQMSEAARPSPDDDPSQVQLQAEVGGDEPKSLVEAMRVGS